MTDVELAVQVISLVEKSAGKQVVAGLLKPLSTHILSTHRNLAGTRDWFPKFGNAKAAFILCVLSFSVNNLGIHQDQLRLGIPLKVTSMTASRLEIPICGAARPTP